MLTIPRTRCPRRLVLGALAALVVASGAAIAQEPFERSSAVDRHWLAKLDRTDRALLDELVGYAPPGIDGKLAFHRMPHKSWKDLAGRVVVIQSFTSKTSAGRLAPQRARTALEDFSPNDVQLVALHTPDGAGTARTFLERRDLDIATIIDSRGDLCDALGVYRQPVNIIVDRNGKVRFAGLNEAGLVRAVQRLVDEPYDPSADVPKRPETTSSKRVPFPTFSNAVRNATDLRGQRAPELAVDHWITSQPSIADKVVIVDFWATWCGPCVAAMPHMNELANTFPNDVQIVGISSESRDQFDRGMQQLQQRGRLSLDRIDYALGLDTQRRMRQTVQNRSIPHVLVISSDWTVRWQGHPSQLHEKDLRSIVEADRGIRRGARPRRWTGG